MGKLIRRCAGVVGIVLLVLLALPEPAQACYACEDVLACYYFGGFVCFYVSQCRDKGSPCGLCYEGCMEGFDTCGNIGPPCQFALNSPAPSPDLLAGGTTFTYPIAR
jgi:hypothetical protein